ncbi:MAG: ATP-binding cassette domain-containing protein [Candidatus Cloacimonetes bacterium]|nr:ATP-binding cassette domain-containing protein [Candidatus Cloacimonadota bacterium]
MVKQISPVEKKISPEKRENLVKMVAELYIHLLRSDEDIAITGIDTLYILLENLFKDEDRISWESYFGGDDRQTMNYEEVVRFLNRNLITLDKIRILLSIIVLAQSDSRFSVSEVTWILELSRQMNLETDGFLAIIDAMEYHKSNPVSIRGFKYFSHTSESLFTDYLIFGSADECSVRFRNNIIKVRDLLLLVIDHYLFIGTNIATNATINGEQLKPNRLYYMPEQGVLEIGEQKFNAKLLHKMYLNRDEEDIINFTKPDYEFQVTNNHNRFSVISRMPSLLLNNKRLNHHRIVPLFYDDVLQIEGYSAFSILEIIERRAEIGVDNLRPEVLYIFSKGNQLELTRTAVSNPVTIINVEADRCVIQTPRRGWEIFVNNRKVEKSTPFYQNTDILTISKQNFRLNSFFDLIEIPFDVEKIKMMDLKHYFRDGSTALDGISLEAAKGEFIAIMGQSGCGKSTLLRCIAGDVIPSYGSLIIDGKDFYRNQGFFSQYIGYIPQDDLLYSSLTVYENLLCRGRLQMPNISEDQLNRKIDNLLMETNLLHRKHTQVGDFKNVRLSGGERKRLNIALELLSEPTLIVCDEPTSGLSSLDSEQIINMLKSLSKQGKIVIISVHQPGPDIFSKFDQILLMDRGGKQVFFGRVSDAFSYFDMEFAQLQHNSDEIGNKRVQGMSEYLYQIIEYPELNDDGRPAYIQEGGNLVVKRKFPAQYWRQKFKRLRLIELIHIDESKLKSNLKVKQARPRRRLNFSSHLIQMKTFLYRNFINKLRNKSNNYITFAEAPLLALLVSFILRFTPDGDGYSYNNNTNLGIFLFISIIIFIFLGLSNSIEEILSERRILLREKKLSIKLSYFLFSKLLSLSFFALIQVVLYYIVAMLLLDIRGIFIWSIVYFFFSSLIGISLGLLISCFISDIKAVINILPVLLIPQIIFGGAILEFERMNKTLTVVEGNPIPEVVQVIPSRWLFEGVYTAYAKNNTYEGTLDSVERNRIQLMYQYRHGKIKGDDYRALKKKEFKRIKLLAESDARKKSVNEYVTISVDMMDGKFYNCTKNIFLSSYKHWGNKNVRTWNFNLGIILLYIFLLNALTYLKLKYYFNS